MFIKLSFTADTRVTIPLRILADIINTSSVTSVSALQSRFTAASYAATLTANFDANNSTIIRTVDPANTISHISAPNALSAGGIRFILEQPVYDAPSSKIYTSIASPGGSSTDGYFDIGTLITGGTISSAGLALTAAENSAGTLGTVLTLGGNNYGNVTPGLTAGNGFTNIRTFWAYITDKCFFWAVTNTNSYNVGWGTSYSNSTIQGGPFFQTQYTRFDHHNLDSNGIYPVLWTNQRNAGIGYGTNNDLTNVQNLFYTNNSYTVPLRVHSIVSALPQVATAWPRIYNQPVHMTMNGRTSGNYGLQTAQTAGTATNAALPSYSGSYSNVTSNRYPSADLLSTGFGLMPFGWEATPLGNYGGNASDQCGVYIFNGEYTPGDTFVYNSKTYMIWPMYQGNGQRVGFAVPME
jgi:hypothetical protein